MRSRFLLSVILVGVLLLMTRPQEVRAQERGLVVGPNCRAHGARVLQRLPRLPPTERTPECLDDATPIRALSDPNLGLVVTVTPSASILEWEADEMVSLPVPHGETAPWIRFSGREPGQTYSVEIKLTGSSLSRIVCEQSIQPRLRAFGLRALECHAASLVDRFALVATAAADPVVQVRIAAIDSISSDSAAEFISVLLRALGDPSPHVADRASKKLCDLFDLIDLETRSRFLGQELIYSGPCPHRWYRKNARRIASCISAVRPDLMKPEEVLELPSE